MTRSCEKFTPVLTFSSDVPRLLGLGSFDIVWLSSRVTD